MKELITLRLIEAGLQLGAIIPKLESDGLKAHIGEYWFFFGGSEFEYTEPAKIPFAVLIREIRNALSSFRETPEFQDEYRYYYYYLCEKVLPQNA